MALLRRGGLLSPVTHGGHTGVGLPLLDLIMPGGFRNRAQTYRQLGVGLALRPRK